MFFHAKNEFTVYGVKKDSLFFSYPAPRFVKERQINTLAYNPQCVYHLLYPVKLTFIFYIDFYFCLVIFVHLIYLYIRICIIGIGLRQIAEDR